MEQSDIERMHHLNSVFLARNVANANVQFNPTLLAIIGMLAGAGAFALLLIILKWAGA
ncbi:hypothetical protein [Caulobacter sp. Root1455]|uniref:hypothetical protein n=1 Tax=Caulobacter sp. Root1455 TaxID=1736465 RepID=UPI0012E3BF63|nr:hypothetical protein [Caulobacter sp. Root1455]